MNLKSKIPLLGADKFILALDRHDELSGTSGNTCRYVMELDRKIDPKPLEKSINTNDVANWISKLTLSGKMSNSGHWKHAEMKAMRVEVIESDEIIPRSIMNQKIDRYKAPLIRFHLLNRSNGTCALIFSWHHLLFDGQGAALFLRNILKPVQIGEIHKTRSPFTIKVFRQMVRVKRFIDSTAKGEVFALEKSFEKEVKQVMSHISLTREESENVSVAAIKNGARLGVSAYYLAAVSKVLIEESRSKGIKPADLWIPLPQDIRKRGNMWPILGNQLSFLFYRINHLNIASKKKTVASLNDQMKNQIRKGLPEAYGHLMNYLRIVPSRTYARMIKGPNGKSLTSFLMTITPGHPDQLKSFFGAKVTNAYAIPPNTYPPGFTIAINTFDKQLQVVLLSYEHLFTQSELDQMSEKVKAELQLIS